MFADNRISDSTFHAIHAPASRRRPAPRDDAESHPDSGKTSQPKAPPARTRPSGPKAPPAHTGPSSPKAPPAHTGPSSPKAAPAHTGPSSPKAAPARTGPSSPKAPPARTGPSSPKAPPARTGPSSPKDSPAQGHASKKQPPTPPAAGPRPRRPGDAPNGYDGILQKLPGVVGVSTDGDGITLETRSRLNSKFLDALLEDAIGGNPVHFKERAPAHKAPSPAAKPKPRKKPGQSKPSQKAKPRPHLSAAEKVVKQFGKALSGLPHVVGVEAAPQKAAGGKTTDGGPGPVEAIIVKVDGTRSVRWLDNMLEDTINGVLVQFEPSSSFLPPRT